MCPDFYRKWSSTDSVSQKIKPKKDGSIAYILHLLLMLMESMDRQSSTDSGILNWHRSFAHSCYSETLSPVGFLAHFLERYIRQRQKNQMMSMEQKDTRHHQI